MPGMRSLASSPLGAGFHSFIIYTSSKTTYPDHLKSSRSRLIFLLSILFPITCHSKKPENRPPVKTLPGPHCGAVSGRRWALCDHLLYPALFSTLGSSSLKAKARGHRRRTATAYFGNCRTSPLKPPEGAAGVRMPPRLGKGHTGPYRGQRRGM